MALPVPHDGFEYDYETDEVKPVQPVPPAPEELQPCGPSDEGADSGSGSGSC
ncbi:hypothetical protein ACWCXB_04005 [Streptomyces sp. NPDC001514]